MKRTKRNGLVGTLFVLGSVLLGAAAAKEGMEQLLPGSIPAPVWSFVPLIGLLMLVFAGVLWLVIRVPLPALMPNYECYIARESELKCIHELAEKYLGDVSPLTRMISWHRVNSKIFKVVYRVSRKPRGKSKSMVGYYCIIPINAAAVEKLRSKEITGAEFQSEHIVREGQRADAVYVGAIVASGMLAQGNTRSLLQNELVGNGSQKAQRAFTRPTTKQGMRLVREHEFTAVDAIDDGKLNALYTKALSA